MDIPEKPPVEQEPTASEARILIFSLCVALPFAPTDEQNKHALAMLCKVAKEGMKLDIISAQVTQMTEEQARKAFADAELDEAQHEAKGSIIQ